MYAITKRLPTLAGLVLLAFTAACSTDAITTSANPPPIRR
jgi:hypothetical protein